MSKNSGNLSAVGSDERVPGSENGLTARHPLASKRRAGPKIFFYIFEALYDTHLKQFLTPRFTHAKKYGKDLKNFLKIGLRPTFFSEMCCRSFLEPVYTFTFRKFKNFDRSPYARLLSAIFAFLPKTDRHPLTGVGEVKRFK